MAIYLDNLRQSEGDQNSELFRQMKPFWELVSNGNELIAPQKYPLPDEVMRDALAGCVLNNNNKAVEVLHQLNCLITSFQYYFDLMNDNQIAKKPTNQWVLQSPNFDDMCTDFMAPIMRGMLSPSLDRGDALCRFWTERFQWHDSTNFEGYTRDGNPAQYDSYHPAVLFNATNVLDGKRLVAAFPPYEKNPALRLTTMSEFDTNRCLSLSRAVRMSSNFPFGFRMMKFQSPDSDNNVPLKVLDGGVVDNTGLDTLYEAFRGFEHYMVHKEEFINDKNTSEDTRKYIKLSEQLLEKLRKKDILLVEIDAGAKPSQESGGSLEAVAGPLNAMGNSAYLNSELNKKFYINELRNILCRQPGSPENTQTVLHFRFECNHYDPLQKTTKNDAMTAWTLGPQDKANVICRFELELDRWQKYYPKMLSDLSLFNLNILESNNILIRQGELFRNSQKLVKDLSSELINFDQKTKEKADMYNKQFRDLTNQYNLLIQQVENFQKTPGPKALGLNNQKDTFASIKENLANADNLLMAKNAAVKTNAKLKDLVLDLKEYNPQKLLDKSAIESQRFLGNNNPNKVPKK